MDAVRSSVLTCLFAASLVAAPVRLPTGVLLDPAAPVHEVGAMALGTAVAPGGGQIVLLTSNWAEQALEVVDTTSGELVQKVTQPAAFVGIAFAPDGRSLWTSGGNDNALYRYPWRDGRAGQRTRFAVTGMSYPAGLAFAADGKVLYVAENLGDSIAVVDTASGRLLQRLRTDAYPYGVAVSAKGAVFVSCWGDRSVIEFRRSGDLLKRRRRIEVGRHPAAMLPNGERLYVTSPSTDSIAEVDIARGVVVRTLSDAAPAGPHEGVTPNALALSRDGSRLFVAEADANAVGVFDLRAGKLAGRIPTQWYPTGVLRVNEQLFVVCGKGGGTAPNPALPQPDDTTPPGTHYTLGQLRGSVMRLPAGFPAGQLAGYTRRVVTANGWSEERGARTYPPFEHVVYVIKENRTYDQVLGDLPDGDGDPKLVYFPRAVSPNHHALAERFGLFDRFFVNAEVSAQGHNWSTAAWSSDYVEKTVPSEYSHRGRDYDYEGSNRDRLVDDEDDVAAPSTGYLWDLAVRKGISLRNYGEFVSDSSDADRAAARRALTGTTNLRYPGFDLSVPDQHRADIWLEDLARFTASGSMPALQIVRLPNDHTAAASAGKPTPRACMADNDLALGRMVEGLSRSPFWKTTLVLVVEDDAQDGPDHVDSHRSVLLVISPYNRAGTVHRFVNTTDVLASIEEILGLDSLSTFDHFGRPLHAIFAGEPDLRPYETLRPAVDLDEKNPAGTPAAKMSEQLDLSKADSGQDALFNEILAMVK